MSTLLGHTQVGMALLCLGSLRRCSAEPLALRLHDDGSLTDEDLERLREGLGDLEVVPRVSADAEVEEALARHPATRELRRVNPLMLKLVDVALLHPGDELAYCDTDILFLRPFSGLFRFPAATTGAVFMSDRQNAYSIRSWHLLLDRRLRLPRRVNTGILHFRLHFFDLDLIEWYLSRPEYRFAPVWTEQTCWALLGQAAGCRLLDPAQVTIPEPGPPRPGPVALHFVSSVRSLLPAWQPLAARNGPEAPVGIASVPVRRCRTVDLAADEFRRLRRRHSARSL